MTHDGLVWITGADGLIGNYLVQAAPRFAPQWNVRGLTRRLIDLLDFDAVRRTFKQDRPALIIHCAAMSRSADCQRQPDLARKTNVAATAVLAEFAADIPFFFFSTDLVFDGRKGNYVETDAVSPLHIYAETKVAAEKIVLANPRHTVIRAALNGGTSKSGDRGFNEQLRCAFTRGETVKLFTDEFRCPIPAEVTARAVWELAAMNCRGLYHLAGSERLSRWEIGQLIAARWPQLNPRLEPALASSYDGPPRPADVSLNCSKVQRLLSFQLPGLGDWLAPRPRETF